MLCIDKAGDATPLLHLRYHMKRHRRLSAGLRTVNLHNTSPGNAAQAKSQVQTQAPGGNGLHIHMDIGVTKLHDRAFTKLLLNLGNRRIQCF